MGSGHSKKLREFNDDGKPICGAKTRKAPGYCQGTVLMNGGRCRMHGGASQGRPWTTGKYSKRLRELRERFGCAVDDPELLDLRPGISVYDDRIRDLMDKLDDTDCPEFRERAVELMDEVKEAARQGFGVAEAITALDRWLRKARMESRAWTELLNNVDRRAVRTENAIDKYLKGANAITERDFRNLLSIIIDMVIDEAGPESAKRIVNRLHREISRRRLELEETSSRLFGDDRVRELPGEAE